MPETGAEENGVSALLTTQDEFSLPIAPIVLRVTRIRDLIDKIPLTIKTHDAQNAAYAEACNYLDELSFLQRLANTIKREQREIEKYSATAQPQNVVQGNFLGSHPPS